MKLFNSQGDAGCITCHKDYGRKNNYLWDDWGTIVKPANLTRDIYRGGRRPIDFFWRIHGGIAGVGMAGFSSNLKDDQIWDLVNFLMILPYPKMREQYGIRID